MGPAYEAVGYQGVVPGRSLYCGGVVEFRGANALARAPGAAAELKKAAVKGVVRNAAFVAELKKAAVKRIDTGGWLFVAEPGRIGEFVVTATCTTRHSAPFEEGCGAVVHVCNA